MFDKSYSGDMAIAASQSLKERDYWLKKLSGGPGKINFPYDNKEPDSKRDKERVDFCFSEELFSRMTWISNQSDSRLLTVLTAGLIALVNKYSGSEDIIIGMPIYKQEVEGNFINTVVALRCLVPDDITFKDLLYKVKQTIDEAFEHQNYPIKTLLYDLQHPFSEIDFPLFDIVLMLKNIQDPLYVSIPVNMEFVFLRNNGNLEVAIQYNCSLYERETVERIAGHLSNLLRTAIFNVNVSLSEIDILAEEEKKKLLEEFNHMPVGENVPISKTIHRLFENQVEKTPDAAAIVFARKEQEFEFVTYRQLNEKSQCLVIVLKEKGITTGHIAALLIESSLHMAVAILSVLKAGGAYLPIDMEAPWERKTFILKDSGVRILLTGSAGDKALFPKIKEIEQLDISAEHLYTYPVKPSSYDYEIGTCTPGDPAYIIYTSGSTGNPKGVVVEHLQAVNTLVYRKKEYCLLPGHTALQLFSYAFDGFITSFFTPIVSGARVILLSKDIIQDISKIVDVVDRLKVTHLISVPILFQALLTAMTVAGASSLQVVTLAGDKVQPHLLQFAALKNKNIEVVNEYGVTEAAVMSTIYRHQERDRRVKIGHPIDNTSIYITKGNDRHLAPIGVFGEMCIAGAGLARGYLNNPQLTAEKFIRFHHSKTYCTGDIARWLPNGNIEYSGRADFQVKVRGFRIELEEIERQLQACNNIKEAIVVAFGNNEGDHYLCAYIVSKDQLNVPELKEYLASRLPDYMVPVFFVSLEKMPLLPSGKVDRKKLPPPSINTAAEYTPPRDRLECKLVEIWAEVLGIQQNSIGIDANFFELGGHSLKATLLANRIFKEFNIKIAMIEIFKSPDIRSTARLIKGEIEDIFVSITPTEDKEYYALAPGQRRLFILYQMDFKSLAYNVSMSFILEGNVDPAKLEQTFRQLIARHESLRTSFTTIGEQPIQIVHRNGEWDFKIEYYNGESLDDSEIANLVNNFIRPFDLSKAPLMRVGVIQTKLQEHILVVDMHHIITDGVSHKILIENFMNLYRGMHLPQLKLQYRDYSEWQRRKLVKEALQRQEEFWLQQLAGEIPKLDLPTDFPRPAVKSFEGNGLGFYLDSKGTNALREIAASQNATLFMVLLAIYNIFLSKISNQEDIIIGTPVAGRRHIDLEQIIGIFINMLALRNAPCGEITFNTFLNRIKQRTIESFDNQDYAFSELVEKIVKDRDVTRNPLFDVMFVMQNMFEPSVVQEGIKIDDPNIKPYTKQEKKSAQFDLTLVAIERNDTLYFSLEYSTKLFRKETIARFIQYLNKVITLVIERLNIRISEIEIISEEEKNRILYEFNAVKANYPTDKTIHQLFEEQVEMTPDRIAIVGICDRKEKKRRKENEKDNCVETLGAAFLKDQHQITYCQLNEQSDSLALLLIEKSVKPGNIVGIMLERSIDLIIGILGILKAGGAYLPINPDYPEERIDYMLKDSSAKLLITDNSKEGEKVKKWKGEINYIDELYPPSYNLTFLPSYLRNSSGLAYIIYTSGSTGQSKGVPINHTNLSPLLHWGYQTLSITPSDRSVQNLSYFFDWSAWEIFITLTSGASLYMVSDDLVLDAERYLDFIYCHAITILHITPTHFQSLLYASPQERLTTLRYLCIGAEKLNYDLVEHSFKLIKENCRVFNMYGPTEATIMTAVLEIHKSNLSQYSQLSSIPIGKPLGNNFLLILDRYMHPSPLSVPGELFVGGDGIALGYLNKPELTAEKFIDLQHSFSIGNNSRLYRTGDLVRWLPDGNIEFLERLDYQVKIRGYRIELGEIENCLLKISGVKEVIVLIREDEPGDKYLCAYFVSDKKWDISELREYLANDLPDYMIPTYFIQLERLPLNPNNKVDRSALPEPTMKIEKDHKVPRDMLEEALANLWSECLKIEKCLIGIDSNFFQLGGHSLKAITLITKIQNELNVKLTLADLFKMPTIKKLAQYIKNADKGSYRPIEAVEKREYYDGSYSQKRLWILEQYGKVQSAYNISSSYVFEKLNRESFERAFQYIVKRHEILRTTFINVDGEPKQKINDYNPSEIKVHYIDLREEKEQDELVRKLSVEQVNTSFNLEKGSLIKTTLINLKEDRCILIVTIHHIIIDAWSLQLLINEIISLYNSYENNSYESGEEISLPPLRIQYKDFTAWQNQELSGEKLKMHHDYWWQQLKEGRAILKLKTDFPRPSIKTYNGSAVHFQVDEEIMKGLISLNQTNQVSFLMTLITLLTVLLFKYTGQEDIIIGLPVLDRGHSQLENQVGFYINTLPIRIRFDAKESFTKLLSRIKNILLESLEHQIYPFELLLEELNLSRDLSRSPLFDVMAQFVDFEEIGGSGLHKEKMTGVTTGAYFVKQQASQFDLSFFFFKQAGLIQLSLIYNTDLFLETSIIILIEKFNLLLRTILSNSSISPYEIDLEIDIEREMKADMKPVTSNFNFE